MGQLQHRCNAVRIGNDGGGFLVEAMPEDRGCVEIRISGEIDLANVDRFAEGLDECVLVPESPSRLGLRSVGMSSTCRRCRSSAWVALV